MVHKMNGDDRWVRQFHSSRSGAFRLFCFPHAGGSASYYYPLSEFLSPDVEVLGVQYPGRQDRMNEDRIESMTTLADQVFEVLQKRDDRPFAFLGHSMGSILAFEVAQRFKQMLDTGPSWLFTSASPAPSRLRGGTVHLRDDHGLIDELRMIGGVPADWLQDRSLMDMVLPVVRSDYTVIETHPRVLEATVDYPITMFVGDSDPYTTIAEADAWREHTREGFELKQFPGGHFYVEQRMSTIGSTVLARLGGIGRTELAR